MTKDLYKILGIEKSATKKEINSAFKNLMKTHHPDRNGGLQTTEFDEIRKAYDTLNNDGSRHLYDEFGVIPGDEESARKMNAVASLCQVFANIVTSIAISQLESLDLIGAMKSQVVASKQSIMKQKADMEKKLKDFTKARDVMKKRLKHKSKTGNDFLMSAIEENIKQFPLTILAAAKQIVQHDDMLEMLKEYEYDREKVDTHHFATISIGLNFS